MKRSKFSDEQIIAVVKEQKIGVKAAEPCRKHGISDATLLQAGSAVYAGVSSSAAALRR